MCAHPVSMSRHPSRPSFPKTYPAKAALTFAIQKPILGISNEQTTTLLHVIQNEARNCRGAEMNFQIFTFCQDWLTSHVVPPVELPGSLAKQMTQHALEEERLRRDKEAAAAEEENERAAQLAQELEAAVKDDVQRQLQAKEQQYESFSEEVVVDGVRFHAVKIFHPCTERLGTSYAADPLKMTFPQTSGSPRPVVLYEASPGSSLRDVLEDCDSIKETRASEYIVQILSALNTVRTADLVHRSKPFPPSIRKVRKVKLSKAVSYTRLLDLHCSNPFGPGISLDSV
ncbi:hypothetical protein B0H15DRAFT_1025779 [Mycena belliarum]|uniref:RWD domain-containing protein n=1 Tax=Mycena belliarum TaxID=1033014 RepID=A0AAD6TTG3_9AGAR|nr:hypothetical protein B0H15DRAFT_1025779 [Mycena belliae]